MVTAWHSLYLRSDDSHVVATHLREVLQTFDYTLYDPFDIIPGAAYAQSTKAFVAPSNSGWVRIIGAVDALLLPQISQIGLCVSTMFDNNTAEVIIVDAGEQVTLHALAPYLHEGSTTDSLSRALTQPVTTSTANDGDFPMDVLPDDLQDAAKDLSPKHINRMFGKLMKKVHRQLGGGAEGAHDLLRSSVDWNNIGGQRLRAFMTHLNMPEGWHTPDFITLRDAYQLHLRKQRNPDAPDYPGDADAMQAVPSALAYLPVYGGK